MIVEYAQWHPYALNKTPFDDFAVPQVALALTQSANGAEFAWKKLSKEFGKAMRPVVMEGMFVSDGELSESALFAFMAVASAPALIGLGGVDVKQARKQLDEFVANVDKAGMKKEDLIKSFGEILTALESRDQALKGPEHAVARQSNKDAIELYGLIKKAVERGKDDDIRALVVNSERRFHAVPGLLSSGATVVGAEPNRESHVRALSALQADSLDTALSSVTGPALPRAAFDEFVVRARNEAHVKRAASSPPSSEGPAVSMVVIGAAHDLSESVKQWNAAHPNDQILLVRAAAVKFGQ